MFHYIVILIKWTDFKDIRYVGLIAQAIYDIPHKKVTKVYKY